MKTSAILVGFFVLSVSMPCAGCFCRSLGVQDVSTPVAPVANADSDNVEDIAPAPADIADLCLCAERSFGAVLAQHFGVDGSLSTMVVCRFMRSLIARNHAAPLNVWVQAALSQLNSWADAVQKLIDHNPFSRSLAIPPFTMGEIMIREAQTLDMVQVARRYAQLKYTSTHIR